MGKNLQQMNKAMKDLCLKFVKQFDHWGLSVTALGLYTCYSHYLKTSFSPKPNSIQINRKAMNRNWSNKKANPGLKTRTGNKLYTNRQNTIRTNY